MWTNPDCREAEYADSLLNMLQRQTKQSVMLEVGWAELKVSHSQANVQQLEGAINNHILGISGLRLFLRAYRVGSCQHRT